MRCPNVKKAIGGVLRVLVGLTMLATVCRAQPAQLSVTVVDAATEEPVPVRVRLVDERGATAPLPAAAVKVMYGQQDQAQGYGFQPDSAFYVDGSFEAELQPGTYTLTLSKGNEYLQQQHQIAVEAGDALSRTYRLERWIDMPARGWYSADDHIHIRRSPREEPHILDWVEAEDVHVGILLWMGDFWATYYAQYAWGKDGVYREDDYLIASGQEEPRTPELGHTIGIGAEEPVRFRNEYYYYDKVFDRIHELGGMTGYAHQAVTFHGYQGLVLYGLRGMLDVLELLQFCAEEGPLFVDHYYHLLDLGFELTATAGSDFPWCGKDHRYDLEDAPEWASQIGNVRFYTYTGDTFSYDQWKAGLEAGHTFVSSGPILDLKVDGALPGERVDVAPGSTLKITARAYGHGEQVPLQDLEIIGHGRVLQKVSVGAAGQSPEQLTIDMELPVEHGMWIAAKARAGPLQVAHTTPVYVTVAGGGFHNPETVSHYLDVSEQYLQELEHELANPGDQPDHQAWRYREGLELRIAETRRIIARLRTELQ